MKYFDYETVAREANIPPEKKERLVQLMREEFPNDPLMCELHVLRACMAIRDGHITLEREKGTGVFSCLEGIE